MYNDVDIIEFGDEIYNYTTGLIPINKECRLVFEFIHQNNIKYAFITGRRDYIRDITIENLNLVNLNHYSYLFTCPNDYIDEMKKFKEMCRKTLTQERLNIVYTIGDQLSDISGSNNGIPILLYNPFYKTD
jgi:histidinol phosphatase-like enzyme